MGTSASNDVDPSFVEYGNLDWEVDVEKTPPTELSSQKDLAMEVEHADDVERLEASLVDPGVIIGLTTPNSTQSQAPEDYLSNGKINQSCKVMSNDDESNSMSFAKYCNIL
ncbi:hypothetical protein ACOSQ4_021216 [Xanthoceras sorbifolium]